MLASTIAIVSVFVNFSSSDSDLFIIVSNYNGFVKLYTNNIIQHYVL